MYDTIISTMKLNIFSRRDKMGGSGNYVGQNGSGWLDLKCFCLKTYRFYKIFSLSTITIITSIQ